MRVRKERKAEMREMIKIWRNGIKIGGIDSIWFIINEGESGRVDKDIKVIIKDIIRDVINIGVSDIDRYIKIAGIGINGFAFIFIYLYLV